MSSPRAAAWVKSFLDKIKNAISKLAHTDPAIRALMKRKETLAHIAEQFNDAIRESEANRGENVTVRSENEGVRSENEGIISNPVAISEYKEPGTISVFGYQDIKDKPTMVGVVISKNRGGYPIAKIRTFNIRSDAENLLTGDKILYLGENKKKTVRWFQANGIQVPCGGTRFGLIRSLPLQEADVKDETAIKESRKATDDLGAIMSEDRIDALIESSGAGKRKDYARRWITSINPTDFIDLTTGETQDRSVFDRMPGERGEIP